MYLHISTTTCVLLFIYFSVVLIAAAFADDDFDEEIAEITSNQAAEIEMAISSGKLDCDVSLRL